MIKAIDNEPGSIHYALPLEPDGDAQQVCLFMGTDGSSRAQIAAVNAHDNS